MPKSKFLSRFKKTFLKKLLAHYYSLIENEKPLVVFEACTLFHLEHFKNTIESLSSSGLYSIAVIGPINQEIASLKNVSCYEKIRKFPFHKKPDLFISTDLGRLPYWFGCTTAFFGHGVGPKLAYQDNESLDEYDYIFSPCRSIYDVQIKKVTKEKVIPVGLPILETNDYEANDISIALGLDSSKPILVYAPSWCDDISKISDIEKIINHLRKKDQFNLVVCPHPLLFVPERCDGIDFFGANEYGVDLFLNRPGGQFSTLDIVKVSSVVVSDISSILFEAMALNKKVLFDGNRDIFDYSNSLHVYDEVLRVCEVPDWDSENDQTVERIVNNDSLALARKEFIHNYVFNVGSSSELFLFKIKEILSK